MAEDSDVLEFAAYPGGFTWVEPDNKWLEGEWMAGPQPQWWDGIGIPPSSSYLERYLSTA